MAFGLVTHRFHRWLTIAALGSVVSIGGDAGLLAFWHDPATMLAIHKSGGLDEVFLLPFLLMLPGSVDRDRRRNDRRGSEAGRAGLTFQPRPAQR
jgi:hypothetical protein